LKLYEILECNLVAVHGGSDRVSVTNRWVSSQILVICPLEKTALCMVPSIVGIHDFNGGRDCVPALSVAGQSGSDEL